MSLENLVRFSEIVNGDKALQRSLSEVRDPQELVRRAIRMGAERGLPFTAEELEQKLRKVQPGNGELSDDQLDSVAGGAVMAEYGLLLALIAVVCISDTSPTPSTSPTTATTSTAPTTTLRR